MKNNIKPAFHKLNAYDHLLVFMSILTILKVVSVFASQGAADGLHILKLAAELFLGSSLFFFVFKYLFDKTKTYKNALISTFILHLVLAHDKPYLLGGIIMMSSIYVSKFFIKVNKKNIFNPIVFGIGFVSLLSLFIPAIDTPPATFELLNFRYSIFNIAFPVAFIFLTLSLIFNTRRANRLALALSFIIPSLLFGLLYQMNGSQYILYALGMLFTGVVIIIEPKTSPGKVKEQILYGLTMAIFIAGLIYLNVPNSIFIGLFLGNIGYAFHVHKSKQIKKS